MGREREPALDGIRAVAVLAVVLFHSHLPGVGGGARGVDVFFVLSGYLITSILKRQADAGGIDVAGFWRRRAARLVPALLAVLAAYVCLAPLLFPGFAGFRWLEAILAATYLYDYSILIVGDGTPLNHMWSLAVEAQFYALWPFLVPRLARLRNPAAVLLAGWLAVTLLRLGIYLTTDDGPGAYYPLHTRSTGILLGAALAFSPPRMPRLGWYAMGALLVLFATEGGDPYAGMVWRVSAAELVTALLIAHLAQPSRLTAVLAWDPLRRVGLISYALYLWHFPVWAALHGMSLYPRALAAFVVALALAALSFVTVERWGRRLARPRPSPVSVPA